MSQSSNLLVFPVKFSIFSYVWTGMHVLYKPKVWFQVVPRLATAQTPIGSAKFDYAPPLGLTGKCPTIACEGEGRGNMGTLGIDCCIYMERYLIFYSEPFPHPRKTVPNPLIFC